MLTIIAALDRKGVIGWNNQLPWSLPEDLQFFKKTTLGHAILMGRLTYESIGRPLPGRRNLLMSRQAVQLPGVEVVGGLQQALDLVKGQDLFVIGGVQIFEQALPIANELRLTEIEHEFNGDTFFPHWEKPLFEQLSKQTHVAKQGWSYSFVHYRRKAVNLS